jgi:hypothetical protein
MVAGLVLRSEGNGLKARHGMAALDDFVLIE